MKTISYALATAGLLALTACGGGGKANNASGNTAGNSAANSTAPVGGDLNSSGSEIPPVNTSGTGTSAPYGNSSSAGNTANISAGNASTANSATSNSTKN